MYTIIVHNKIFKKNRVVTCRVIPQIGWSLPCFYAPLPIVKEVILNVQPDKLNYFSDIIESTGVDEIDALVTVG